MLRDYFGESVAERYDESQGEMFQRAHIDSVVDFLVERAGGGAALELGIGTGRIALPLAERGVRVHGIDLSEAMVARLRAKPGAEQIGVTIGDFATTTFGEKFSIAYLVFNTIMNLKTQVEQVTCFQNVDAHLIPRGFVIEVVVPDLQRLPHGETFRLFIEVMVPDLQRLPHGETFRLFNVSETHVGMDEYDIANQGLISHHYRGVGGSFERSSIPFRYVWPAELDLMALNARMTLRERFSGWQGEPFTSDSTKHVSVWERL